MLPCAAVALTPPRPAHAGGGHMHSTFPLGDDRAPLLARTSAIITRRSVLAVVTSELRSVNSIESRARLVISTLRSRDDMVANWCR